MPIIQPPKVVQNAVDEFLAPLFKNKLQRKHLANYLTGLMISENKTVAGMSEELPNASDQSCLNRFMILWRYKNDKEPRKILVTNRIHWNPERIVTTYRGRWSCTETLYFRNTDRDGKQELGLGDCQLRGDLGQTRHTYMVFLAYSLLVRELDKTSVSDWAFVKLTTIGESCRALLRDSIRTMIGWIVEQLDNAVQAGANRTKRLEQLLRRLGLGGFQLQ